MKQQKMIFDHRSGSYLDIGSARIYYEMLGKVDNPVLLFLHGGLGSIEDFNVIIPALKENYRIIGIDSRGQGQSTLGSEELTYERIQKDVLAILDKLGIDELSIIGLSDGGIVTYRLACFSSLKIKKLITIGSRWHSRNALETKDILGTVTAERWKEKFPQTYEKYQSLNPQPDFEKLVSNIIKMWLDSGGTGYPNENVKNINCPSLLIRGDKDHLIKRDFIFELAKLIKDCNLANIPFASHVVYAEQKDILIRMINEFLTK